MVGGVSNGQKVGCRAGNERQPIARRLMLLVAWRSEAVATMYAYRTVKRTFVTVDVHVCES